MTCAILNVAVGERYLRAQDRLAATLDAYAPDTQRMFWRGKWPGKSHHEQPYGFKLDALRAAEDAGHHKALWLDSVAWAQRPLDLVWDYLDRVPALVMADGWNLGQWTSDAALKEFRINRNRAMGMQLCLAGILGINFGHPNGMRFLSQWEGLRDKGCFRGPWTNESGQASNDPRCRGHRHDQSAASWLCYEIGIPMAHLQAFCRYENQDAPDAVFAVTGI